MNLFYLKTPRGRWLLLCGLSIITVLIIHSCKKESKSVNPDQAVADAQNWYESNYPALSTGLGSHQLSLSRTPGGNATNNSVTDFSQMINPDWQHNAVYKRFNKDVVEMPVDPTSNKYNFGLGSAAKNYNKAYTRTSFLILKGNNNTYSAYVMMVMADSSYVNNDLTKLAHNTYRKHDTDFSGMVLYFTPKGRFISGWVYKNGQLLPVQNTTASTAASSNLSSRKLTLSRKTTGAKTLADEDPFSAPCTNYYLVTYDLFTGVIYSSEFLYSDCSGGGSSVSPCDTAGTASNLSSTYKARTLANTAPIGPPPDPDPSDPGFPDPTTTTSTCYIDQPVTDTPKTPCDLAKQLSLNSTLISKFNSLKDHLDDNNETGYMFTNASDPTTYIAISGDPNTMDMNISVSGQIAGIIHDHPDGAVHNDGSPVLSSAAPTGDDVSTMYTLLMGNNMINPLTFFLGGITANGTAFTVQIANVTQFKTWAATNLAVTNNTTPFQTAINNSVFKYYNNEMMGIDISNVLAFLDNIAGSGLSLSFANYDNLNNWTPVTSSNGTVVNTNCNN